MFDFDNQVVMVTGAAGNLGRAVASAFLAAGARLVLVDHASGRLATLFPEFADLPEHALVESVDLTDEAQVKAAVEAVYGRFGRIDVLVNVVGGYRAGTPVHETPVDMWDFMLNLNARTVFLASSAVIPVMLERGSGRIINVSSRAALQGSRRAAAYSASKSAVLRLTESMSAELKKSGIRVNCVLPGTIDTPENRSAMPKADRSLWVEPQALADVVMFLASDAARAIHGASIPVYGIG